MITSDLFTRTNSISSRGLNAGFNGSASLLSNVLYHVRVLFISDQRVNANLHQSMKSPSGSSLAFNTNPGFIEDNHFGGLKEVFQIPRARLCQAAHATSFMAQRGLEKIFG